MVLDQIKSKMESQIKKWRNGSSTSREQSRINPEEISLKGTSASLNLSADEGNNLKIFFNQLLFLFKEATDLWKRLRVYFELKKDTCLKVRH